MSSLDPPSTHGHTRPDYLVRTSELPPSALERRVHPIVRTNGRDQLSLGDSTGLTKTGVHLCRLPPGATSTTLHWHKNEDEWFYILEGGEGAVLLLWEPEPQGLGAGEGAGELQTERQPVVSREEKLKTGDFLGFKSGIERAHAFRAGEEHEMLYLVGGSRVPMDVTHYPAAGQTLVVDRETGQEWTVEDAHIRVSEKRKSPPVLPSLR